MKNTTLFLILIFYSELADVQCKRIEQRFRQDIFFAATEETANSPILLQYAKLSFGLNGAIHSKLLAQICCDPGMGLRAKLPKRFGKLNGSACFGLCALRLHGTFTARFTTIHTLFGHEAGFALGMFDSNVDQLISCGAGDAVGFLVVGHIVSSEFVRFVFFRLIDFIIRRLDIRLNPHFFKAGIVFFAFISRVSDKTFRLLSCFFF